MSDWLSSEGISVVIPTHLPRNLEPTLKGLSEQTEQGFEVVVIENGDRTDRVRSTVRNWRGRLNLAYHHVPEAGLNRARNLGAQRASGRCIAIIDDDCRPACRWIEGIVICHNEMAGAGVIGGPVELDFEKDRPDWLLGEFRTCLSQLDLGDQLLSLDEGQYLIGANISFSRSLFVEAGGFPEHLGMSTRKGPQLANDEIAFFDRVRKVAQPALLYCPRMKVFHNIPSSRTSLAYMFQRRWGQGLSDVSLIRWRHVNDSSVLDRRFVTSVYPHPWHRAQLDERLVGLDTNTASDYLYHHVVCRTAYLSGFTKGLENIAPSGSDPYFYSTDSRAVRRGLVLAQGAAGTATSCRDLIVRLMVKLMYSQGGSIPDQRRLLIMARHRVCLLQGMLQFLRPPATLPDFAFKSK